MQWFIDSYITSLSFPNKIFAILFRSFPLFFVWRFLLFLPDLFNIIMLNMLYMYYKGQFACLHVLFMMMLLHDTIKFFKFAKFTGRIINKIEQN
jgi:hypothetical protein